MMLLPDFLTDLHGDLLVTGHRVGLSEIIEYYRCGDSVEMLSLRFPTVPLATLHKIIAYYLEHTADVNAYCDQHRAEMDRLRADAPNQTPTLDQLRKRRTNQPAASGV